MEGNQKRRWERLRKLLRLLVGRRKRKRFTLPEDTTIQSLKDQEETGGSGGVPKKPLPPESARLDTLSPSSDLLASLNKFCLSTAASRERLVPQVEESVVFDRPMPLDKLALPEVRREPGVERERQLTSNGLAEQRWRAGSSQCLANLNSWPSKLSLVEKEI